MAVQVKSTDNFAREAGVKIVAYSDAGSGKTHAISTLPDPIIISSERGLSTLRRFKLPYIEVETMAQLTEAVAFLFGSAEMKKYQSVSFDSFTDMAEICLGEEKKKTTNGQKAYGEMADKMIQLCRMLKKFNKHVYITAHIEKFQDPNTGLVRYYPSAPGRLLSDELRYQFDNIFWLAKGTIKETGEVQRMFRTDGDEQYAGKNRSDGALKLWEPVNLTAIINKIQAS